jgi:hypothetical protein
MEPTEKFFAIRKTIEQAKIESEEITKKEMELLAEKLRDNPELLLKKNYNIESSEELDDDRSFITSSSSSSSSSSSCSSSSSDSRRKKYKHRSKSKKSKSDSKNLNFEIYKKEKEVDKLEHRNHLKTLELSNALLEKSKLENECNFLKSKLLEKEILLKIIHDFIEFNIINQIRVFDKKYFTIDKVNDILINIRNDKDKNIKYIKDLQTKIIPFNNSIIGQHYNEELKKNIIDIENNYNENLELIQRFENENKFYERFIFLSMSLLAIIGLVGLRDLLTIYNLF